MASGLCHSDDHTTTGNIPLSIYPMCGGHEGRGVVVIMGIGGIGINAVQGAHHAGVTNTHTLVAERYEDMHAGTNTVMSSGHSSGHELCATGADHAPFGAGGDHAHPLNPLDALVCVTATD